MGLEELAVEEARDVFVFLEFGDAKLSQALAAEDFAEKVGHVHGRDQLEGELVPIAGQAHVEQVEFFAAVEFGEGVIDEGAGQLNRAVLAIVQVQHDVVRLDQAYRGIVGVDQERRADELVILDDVLAGGFLVEGPFVRLANRTCGARGVIPLARGQGTIGFFGAFPVFRAVHRPIAAYDRADDAHARFVQNGLELFEKAQCALRGGVASVAEEVDNDLFAGQPLLCEKADHRVQMVLRGMDALVLHEPHQVELAAGGFFAAGDGFDETRDRKQRAISDHLVDADDFLLDDSPCAHVQVSHFTGTLTAGPHADGFARGVQQAMGVLCEKSVHVRRFRGGDRIARARRGHAPAISN